MKHLILWVLPFILVVGLMAGCRKGSGDITTAPSTTEHVCPTVSNNHVCETGNDIPVAMVVIPWVLAFASVITLLIVLLLPKKKK